MPLERLRLSLCRRDCRSPSGCASSLITQKVSHGWALGSMLAPDGELGRIWTLSRPLTYRAIDGLVDKGLITRTGQAAGRGRDRVLLAADRRRAPCRQEVARRARSSTCATSAPSCSSSCSSATAPASTTSRCWRVRPSCSSRRSTHSPRPVATTTSSTCGAGRAPGRSADSSTRPCIRPTRPRRGGPSCGLSARNQLHGTVTGVHHGEVMATINAVLGDGQPLTAAITKDAVRRLGPRPRRRGRW